MPVRVVLDTNIVISALHARQGNESRVLRLVSAGRIRVCVSKEILAEYSVTLHRPKFKYFPEHVVRSVLDELARGELVQPAMPVTASTDPRDNRFLECAEASGADYLVTGNMRHFPARWGNTLVVNARELLDILSLPA
jgi:putative PIN family toxin of toxin-antitoxin system